MATSARKLVRLSEAAEVAGVHRLTLRRWIAEGRLTAVRVGPRLIKVDIAELESLLQPVGGARSS